MRIMKVTPNILRELVSNNEPKKGIVLDRTGGEHWNIQT